MLEAAGQQLLTRLFISNRLFSYGASAFVNSFANENADLPSFSSHIFIVPL
ncbi:hypothetical protein NWO25_07205 [Enterococcus lactis]|nr:hypothetical protein [Enterococcus lactis]